jgi:hypothetical protein
VDAPAGSSGPVAGTSCSGAHRAPGDAGGAAGAAPVVSRPARSDREPGTGDAGTERETPVLIEVVEPGVWTAPGSGDRWERVALRLQEGYLTSVAASESTVLAVGGLTHEESHEGAFPLVLRRSGGSWEQIAARGLRHYSEGVLGALAVDGQRWVLASTDVDGSTVYESTDAGASWTATTGELPDSQDTKVVTAIAAGSELTFGLESVTGGPAAIAGSRGVAAISGGPASVQAILDQGGGGAPLVISTDADGTQQASLLTV